MQDLLKQIADGKIIDSIKWIADHYGYEAQSRQLIEEMAELTQAINKLWRKRGKGQSTDKSWDDVYISIYEEIADVEIMLQQIKHLLQCEERVERFKKIKLKRQLKRIENE